MSISTFSRNWRVYQKVGLFVIGTAVTFHEVYLTNEERPFVLGFAALCFGLVTTIQADSMRAAKKETVDD